MASKILKISGSAQFIERSLEEERLRRVRRRWAWERRLSYLDYAAWVALVALLTVAVEMAASWAWTFWR